MLRSRSTVSRTRRSLRPPTGKELDLLILAGCSCLMTILYHPVAETMQSASNPSGGNRPIASEVSRTPQSTPIHTTLPPQRETLRKEDEEEGGC